MDDTFFCFLDFFFLLDPGIGVIFASRPSGLAGSVCSSICASDSVWFGFILPGLLHLPLFAAASTVRGPGELASISALVSSLVLS